MQDVERAHAALQEAGRLHFRSLAMVRLVRLTDAPSTGSRPIAVAELIDVASASYDPLPGVSDWTPARLERSGVLHSASRALPAELYVDLRLHGHHPIWPAQPVGMLWMTHDRVVKGLVLHGVRVLNSVLLPSAPGVAGASYFDDAQTSVDVAFARPMVLA